MEDPVLKFILAIIPIKLSCFYFELFLCGKEPQFIREQIYDLRVYYNTHNAFSLLTNYCTEFKFLCKGNELMLSERDVGIFYFYRDRNFAQYCSM